jgi:hypothetical protein
MPDDPGNNGMKHNSENISGNTAGDIKLLKKMIALYCETVHSGGERLSCGNQDFPGVELCRDCANLLEYASRKRKNCVKDPKPSCRNCDTPCYRAEYRDKIKAVMVSGHMRHGR